MIELTTRKRDWWLLAIRGLAAILFGLAAFVWPGLTLEVLVLLFAAYVLVDGIVAIAAFIRRPGQPLSMLVGGAVSIVAGVIAVLFPGIAALSVVVLIAAWAILTGIAEIALTFRLHERLAVELLWVLAGIASILFGIVLIVFPAAGALALIWFIGAYALFLGVLFVILGFSLRAATPRPV
ncbi:MAG TPA: DUF308 domain-containing protein [Candidatus Limnocylindria bacterium]|nr:DUF308 domain-containing protein [Candidatus Limnocylindria bacterium]